MSSLGERQGAYSSYSGPNPFCSPLFYSSQRRWTTVDHPCESEILKLRFNFLIKTINPSPFLGFLSKSLITTQCSCSESSPQAYSTILLFLETTVVDSLTAAAQGDWGKVRRPGAASGPVAIWLPNLYLILCLGFPVPGQFQGFQKGW